MALVRSRTGSCFVLTVNQSPIDSTVSQRVNAPELSPKTPFSCAQAIRWRHSLTPPTRVTLFVCNWSARRNAGLGRSVLAVFEPMSVIDAWITSRYMARDDPPEQLLTTNYHKTKHFHWWSDSVALLVARRTNNRKVAGSVPANV